MAKVKKPTNAAREWQPVPDELDWNDVGGRLLANIARGMYAPQGVLREYVQNAADAYKDLSIPSDDHRIIITPSKNSLSIQDFGLGMDDKGIREAKKIAVSNKSDYDDHVGFRGIGIWAGLPACKRLIVDSTTTGHSYRYRLVFDFEDIMKHVDDNINIKSLIDPRYTIERHVAAKDEHYTRVTLDGITDGYKQLLDASELKRIASQVLPAAVDPKFQHHAALMEMLETWPAYSECHILVQSPNSLDEVFRHFPDVDVEPPTETILVSDEGVELARAWACRTKKTALRNVTAPAVRGFTLRVKNFAVGDVNMFSAEQGYSYNINKHKELKTTSRLTWFFGEVHVTNNRIKPNTPRDDLEREDAARLFIEKLRGFYKDRIIEAGAYSDFNPFRTTLEKAEEIIKKATAQPKGKKRAINVDEAQSVLKKLIEAPDKAKEESQDQSKKKLKQLLGQPWFKNRSAKAIASLQKLLPRQRNGSTAKADKTTSQAKKSKSSTTQGNGEASSTNVVLDLRLEEFISLIFEILERNLGDDYEDLPQIQEEIQQAADAWISSNANKQVP